MEKKNLLKIKSRLKQMRLSPQNRTYREFVEIAKQLGRDEDKRGKEPTFVRKRDPALSPPLSIPKHSGDLKVGTARSIIDALLSDIDDWELYLMETESDEADQ